MTKAAIAAASVALIMLAYIAYLLHTTIRAVMP